MFKLIFLNGIFFIFLEHLNPSSINYDILVQNYYLLFYLFIFHNSITIFETHNII